MRFDFVRDPAIPTGAWCLEVRRRSELVRVRHGELVERIGDDAFCFGAWPSVFDADTLFESSDRTGTAGLIRNGQLVLLAPSHPYSWLNLSRVDDDRLVVSNSLAFAMRATGATPVPFISTYHADLNHILFRPDRNLEIKLVGPSVQPLMLDAFRIDGNLVVHRERRASAVRFDDFASYRDNVTEVLAGFAANATSTARATPFGLMATLSAGYDSPGSLTMAAPAGWNRAVTLVDDERTDVGTVIGEHLGVKVDEVSFDAWKARGPLQEVPFYTVSGPEARLRFVGLEDQVRHTLMITGGFGDASWDASTDDIGPRYAQVGSSAPGERSMNEWLLHIGTIALPVPALGADDFDQFTRLSHSAEMREFRGTDGYDRPISNRLITEQKVPAEAMAKKKVASAWLRGPMEFTPETRADFLAWVAEHPLPLRMTLDRLRSSPVERAFHFAKAHHPNSKTMKRLRHLRKLNPSWTTGRLFHWAHDRISDHYPLFPFD